MEEEGRKLNTPLPFEDEAGASSDWTKDEGGSLAEPLERCGDVEWRE